VDPPTARSSHDARRGKRGEARIPPAIAVLVAIALYAVLPEPLVIGPRFLIPGLELALLVALIATNPLRFTRQTRWSRIASLTLSGLVVGTNLVALGLLIDDLVTAQDTAGTSLLIAAMQVWVTNVIAFGLIYWELDRGGPVIRTKTHPREKLPLADFRFTQDETQDTVVEVAAGSSKKADWRRASWETSPPSWTTCICPPRTPAPSVRPTHATHLAGQNPDGHTGNGGADTSLLVIARAVGALGGG